MSFLANPPSCRVYHDTTQSIPDNTPTTVAFNSERYDTASMHDTVTVNSRITIPVGGLYAVSFTGQLAGANDYDTAYAQILSGATVVGRGPIVGKAVYAATGLIVEANTLWKFAIGDWVTVQVYHDNTANVARNLEVGGSYSPELALTWIGIG